MKLKENVASAAINHFVEIEIVCDECRFKNFTLINCIKRSVFTISKTNLFLLFTLRYSSIIYKLLIFKTIF